MSDFWNDPERIEALRTLVAEGLSGGQIMKAMGAPSRNSVIGKANRLGLRFKNEKKTAIPKPVPPVLIAKVTVAKSVPVEFEHIIDQETFETADPQPGAGPANEPIMPGHTPPQGTALLGILDLRTGHCRWPYDTAEGTQYCGQHADGSFCRAHHRIAYGGKTFQRDPDYQPNRSGRGFNFATLGTADA